MAQAATQIPGIGTLNLPVTRNDLLLLLVAFTQIGLGFETGLAHLISGSIKPGEAIPVIFGPVAGVTLLVAIYLRIRRHRITLSSLIVIGVALASIAVGVIGSAFHWARAVPPSQIAEAALQWDWLIYAPPVAGPLAFAGIGLMAFLSVLEDTKPETGKLTLPGVATFQTPLSQTRQYLWLVALGMFAATLSAFLDHGRTHFEDPAVWIPVVLGLYGSIVALLMALYERHSGADWFIFFWVMVLMALMGILGLGLHFNTSLPETGETIVIERFIRGAPIMAPMLFAIIGSYGIFTMIGADVDSDDATVDS
jgi:hypothetical protein